MRRAFLLLSLTSACSLFTSLDGFSGDADSGDGGPSQSDAASPDAPPASDGSSDASDVDGDSGALGCASLPFVPTFCEDFDGTLVPGWEPDLTPGSLVELATGGASAPSALRSKLVGDAGSRWATWNNRLATPTVSHVRLTYDLLVVTPPSFGFVEVNKIRFESPDESHEIYVDVHETGFHLEEQVATSNNNDGRVAIQPFVTPMNGWHQVTLEITLGSTPSVSLQIDDKGPFTSPLIYATKPGLPFIEAGINWSGASSDNAEVLVDNIVLQEL